jgi:hypothetical protein
MNEPCFIRKVSESAFDECAIEGAVAAWREVVVGNAFQIAECVATRGKQIKSAVQLCCWRKEIIGSERGDIPINLKPVARTQGLTRIYGKLRIG